MLLLVGETSVTFRLSLKRTTTTTQMNNNEEKRRKAPINLRETTGSVTFFYTLLCCPLSQTGLKGGAHLPKHSLSCHHSLRRPFFFQFFFFFFNRKV